jgi:hypothetical protein
MGHIGIDVHEEESQIRILGEAGELRERWTRTTPERFAAVLRDRPVEGIGPGAWPTTADRRVSGRPVIRSERPDRPT